MAGISSEIRIYDSESGDLVASCKGHDGGIFAVTFRPDGARIAAGGFDGTVRIFDAGSGEQLHSFVPVPLEQADAGEGQGNAG